ncbi:MAG: aminomethyl-transferring glycine dehydrogenase, partial [Treponema sp.]|nr:aminomethyl-transferring glycine dehydrogenase [Treponema sp.]
MGSYLANSDTERREMLAAMGRSSVDELFSGIPQKVLGAELSLPPGMAEMEVFAKLSGLASEN